MTDENRKAAVPGRILIIDDNEGTSRTLTLILRRTGYETESVATGREGLERARSRFFNVILLDIRLPDMEGVDLLLPLRRACPETAIILITAFASKETAMTALNRGARLYLTKPLSVDVVLARIADVIAEQHLASEERRSLKTLGESAEQFRRLAEASPDLIFQVDTEGTIAYASPAAEPILGHAPDAVIGRAFLSLVTPEALDRAKEIMRRNLAGEGADLEELNLRHRNSATVPVEVATAPVEEDGVIVGFQGIARDISGRRRAEERLRRTEERLRHLLRSSPTVIYSCRVFPDGSMAGSFRPTFVSGNIVRMLGCEPEECLENPAWWPEHLHPDDAERARGEMARLFREGRLTHEYRVRHREGHYVWILDEVALIRDAAGRAVEFVGSWTDVTGRRAAEAAIRSSAERYRALFQESPISLWEEDFSRVKRFLDGLREQGVTDIRGHLEAHPDDVVRCASWIRVVDVNDATLRMFEAADRSELVRGLASIFAEASYDAFCGELVAVAEGRTSCDVDARVRTLKGKEIDIFLRWSVAPGQERSYARVLVSIIDVTEQKRAEEALRQSERKYRNLVDNALTAVFQTNVRGDVLFANERTITLMGFDNEAEMKQVGVRPMYRDLRDREAFLAKLRETGRVDRYPLHLVTKSGESRHALVYLTIDGEVISGMGIDVTDQVQAERELRRSRERLRDLSRHLEQVREEERREIAREIHDEVGQALTALRFDLAWLDRHLPGASREIMEKIADMTSFVEESIERVKEISARLRPRLLDDLGLIPALEWEAGEFAKRTGVTCRLDLPDEEVDLDSDRETAIFRIFQETLTNVARHAQATRVRARLLLEPDDLWLRVTDNGIGIGSAEVEDTGSLGLHGMRERLHRWGGELTIRGRKGRGTTVTVRLPRERGDDKP